MPLFALIAATSIACLNPAHRDGQSIRCGEKAPVLHLHGITAPAIAAECRGLLVCRDDPGIASRDHLADLTRGQALICTITNPDRRPKAARCTLAGVDLSCLMVADGMARQTGPLVCPPPPPQARFIRRLQALIGLPPLWRWVPLYLLLVNIVTFGAVALDRYRARRAMVRVAPAHLLTLTLFGGGLGGLLALWRLDHLRDEPPFTDQFLILVGLQIGALLGVLLF